MTTTPTKPVRTHDGVDVPIPGVWRVDAGHAEIGFWGRHFMITKVRGRFTDVDAVVTIAERPEDSTVEATISMASVDSGDQTRDDHLRSADFFDVERWPTATYRSTAIEWNESRGRMEGELQIRDVTAPIILDVEFLGAVHDPWGNDRSVFSATGQIYREDWDLIGNMALESGGLLVSKDVNIEIHAELIRESEGSPDSDPGQEG